MAVRTRPLLQHELQRKDQNVITIDSEASLVCAFPGGQTVDSGDSMDEVRRVIETVNGRVDGLVGRLDGITARVDKQSHIDFR